jgi:glycerol kinase
MARDLILALDQGTTGTRAVAFDRAGAPVASAAMPLKQYFPKPGWVEHDAEQIWQDSRKLCRDVAGKAGVDRIAALGVTNQRETTVVWLRKTGRPIAPAIVWQDRRTASVCQVLRDEGWSDRIAERTGLVPDPYFSATKLAWILNHVEGARDMAGRGELAFGTIDSWLVWRLTGGVRHVSDATNAARTMLYDITRQDWDDELLARLDIDRSMLPEVVDVFGEIGETDKALFGRPVVITGLAGDQQAAAIGQACFAPGTIKATYGTGCFVLVNSGEKKISSANRLLTTTAYRTGQNNIFALEGSIFMAGAVMQWLRDGLGLFDNAAESEDLARRADPASGVVMVPAFTGLGAPHWDAGARASISGLTRGAGRAEITRAGLEAVAFQTGDLMTAIAGDLKQAGLDVPVRLRVDGGMAANDWFLQFLADMLDIAVDRAKVKQATALGAAYLAGLGAGLYGSFDDIETLWASDRTFEPQMAAAEREARLGRWRDALAKTLTRPVRTNT